MVTANTLGSIFYRKSTEALLPDSLLLLAPNTTLECELACQADVPVE